MKISSRRRRRRSKKKFIEKLNTMKSESFKEKLVVEVFEKVRSLIEDRLTDYIASYVTSFIEKSPKNIDEVAIKNNTLDGLHEFIEKGTFTYDVLQYLRIKSSTQDIKKILEIYKSLKNHIEQNKNIENNVIKDITITYNSVIIKNEEIINDFLSYLEQSGLNQSKNINKKLLLAFNQNENILDISDKLNYQKEILSSYLLNQAVRKIDTTTATALNDAKELMQNSVDVLQILKNYIITPTIEFLIHPNNANPINTLQTNYQKFLYSFSIYSSQEFTEILFQILSHQTKSFKEEAKTQIFKEYNLFKEEIGQRNELYSTLLNELKKIYIKLIPLAVGLYKPEQKIITQDLPKQHDNIEKQQKESQDISEKSKETSEAEKRRKQKKQENKKIKKQQEEQKKLEAEKQLLEQQKQSISDLEKELEVITYRMEEHEKYQQEKRQKIEEQLFQKESQNLILKKHFLYSYLQENIEINTSKIDNLFKFKAHNATKVYTVAFKDNLIDSFKNNEAFSNRITTAISKGFVGPQCETGIKILEEIDQNFTIISLKLLGNAQYNDQVVGDFRFVGIFDKINSIILLLEQTDHKDLSNTINKIKNNFKCQFQGEGYEIGSGEWYNIYTNGGIDKILELRLKDSGYKVGIIKARLFYDKNPDLSENQIQNNASEIVQALLKARSDNPSLTVVLPLNLNNQHWVGLVLIGDTLYYMDSENTSIPAHIRIALEAEGLTVQELEAQQQASNNCGTEAIENMVALVTGNRIEQKDVIKYHSLLLELDVIQKHYYNQNQVHYDRLKLVSAILNTNMHLGEKELVQLQYYIETGRIFDSAAAIILNRVTVDLNNTHHCNQEYGMISRPLVHDGAELGFDTYLKAEGYSEAI